MPVRVRLSDGLAPCWLANCGLLPRRASVPDSPAVECAFSATTQRRAGGAPTAEGRAARANPEVEIVLNIGSGFNERQQVSNSWNCIPQLSTPGQPAAFVRVSAGAAGIAYTNERETRLGAFGCKGLTFELSGPRR